MKLVPKVTLTVLMFFVGFFQAIAQTPPAPNPFGRRRPPPPPGLPIDDSIFVAVILAIFLGIYLVYTQSYKAKTPM
jgi:uncharacterized membrane-anchored protein YitT (DUF2179 family)